ncbi:uncharacterized protein LOC117170017 [Belonocnema kinseyi]|uniref:uncharacterized protein LOC117170017 n=1 Tax=Belonocnema kinseyi TaxID=2817044 RepID=UPI00143D6498|nr:uncharacterized protein LOC117170017 [Belonocnema kinseyi]
MACMTQDSNNQPNAHSSDNSSNIEKKALRLLFWNARSIVNIITEAIVNNTPKKKIVNNKFHRNPVMWWDSECDKFQRLRTAAFKRWRFTKTLEDFILYKKTCAQATKLFKKKRRTHYRSFASKINFRTSNSYVWNTSKILKNKWSKVKPDHVSENFQTKDKIEIALNKLCPDWAIPNPNTLPTCGHNDFLSESFSFTEFNVALEYKNTQASPGMDGVDFEIIQCLPLKYKLILLDIYNEMYKTENYPDSWKNTYIHFITKPDGKSVRPIALTSCMCKLFESMLKNRMQWWVEYRNILPNSQPEFRKGQSTTDNLTNFLVYAEEAFANKNSVIAAFLDVTGAFDKVLIDILLQKLANI